MNSTHLDTKEKIKKKVNQKQAGWAPNCQACTHQRSFQLHAHTSKHGTYSPWAFLQQACQTSQCKVRTSQQHWNPPCSTQRHTSTHSEYRHAHQAHTLKSATHISTHSKHLQTHLHSLQNHACTPARIPKSCKHIRCSCQNHAHIPAIMSFTSDFPRRAAPHLPSRTAGKACESICTRGRAVLNEKHV